MNLSQLKADINFLCGSTSATYADIDKVRNMNVAYQDVARLIWDSADGWRYDDSNASTLPISKTTLVHNRQDYTLPTTAQRIHRVEVLDSTGNWKKLNPFSDHDTYQAIPAFQPTPGLPLYYSLEGRSILLYPSPASASVTLVSGIAVYVDRDVTEMATTGTTTVPGFATGFHRILSLAAAIDYTKDEKERGLFVAQKARLESGLSRFYGHRMTERPGSINPSSKKKWRQYL